MDPFTTAGLSILGAVLTYVIGQVIVSFIIEPYKQYRGVVARIDAGLIKYGNIIFNECYIDTSEKTKKECDSVRREIRDWASQFLSVYNQLGVRERLILTKKIPTIGDSRKVLGKLIYLANTAGNMSSDIDHMTRAKDEVRLLLFIPE